MSTDNPSEVLERLFKVIESRKGGNADTSYTARLLDGGAPKIGKKLSEEAAEVTIAALSEGKDAVARESADLLYHLLVMWAAMGIAPEDVYAELNKREGTSGIDEKNSRQK
ncbi:MAG: phosphoribosyl-ATP diphosphatase [Rhodospirillales bacterium]|jgi:phosphoribosyl-ATP pyrophosphohydrolase|nr:phosphoribosyl-ATP diphosphatase [Rhodospirillales bacterium]